MKKQKLKLKPTLKEKRHYLAIELLSSERLQEVQAKKIIDESILNFIGKLGYASAGPLYFGFHDLAKNIKSDDKLKFRYILVVSILTKYVDYVKSSLALFDDKDAKISCIGVSGTIEKLKRFLK